MKLARVRKSGLDFVGDINWGTHFCQFYEKKQDLIDVLVPYFSDGLENNEFCVWVTSDFLTKEEAISAMSKSVQDLQDYARPLNPQPEKADMEEIIEKLLAKNGLPKNVKVRVKVKDEAKLINADSYYINRILANLVTNAVQAPPKGGKLTIYAYKEANDTVISVKDTGVGIPKDTGQNVYINVYN